LGTGLERGPGDTITGEMLPGEGLLWTGRPGWARVSLADAGFSAFLLAGLAVLAVFGTAQLRSPGALFKAVTVIVLATGVIQVAAMLIYLLAVKPRLSQRTVYQVTTYRVVVTTGLRTRWTWSAYLDQIDEPMVKRHRDGTEDLVLRAGANSRIGQGVDATFWSGPFSALGQVEVPLLRSLADAIQAQQVAVAARQRMLDGLAEIVPPPAKMSGGLLPAGVVVDAGERVLWAGRPGRVPWWFGWQDIYLSAFMLVWLTFVGLMGAFAVTSGSGMFLIFLVPFAVAGGLYPAVGRVIHRRLRISRSAYVLTDRRLIASWQLSRTPVIVQARLGALLPPAIRGQAIFTDPVSSRRRGRSPGWRHLQWPAATTTPPALIGIADAPAVRELIAAAQLALRAAAKGAEQAQPTAAMDPRQNAW
jgi:hypothetical protein